MNREYIDGFLNYLTSLYNYNKSNSPDFVMEPGMVYTVLVSYGLLGVMENVEPLFNIWIDRFKKRPGIAVFKADDWKYFCQFINCEHSMKDAIKLYIPLKSHNLDLNVSKIFEFLRSNNIKHISKVGKLIRNDNIVIRVGFKEDALKIIDFINNDPDIKKELNPVSPLTLNYKGVGITKDGNRAYNFELSVILAECLNKGMNLDWARFSNYLKQKSDVELNPDLKMIYEIGYKTLRNYELDDILKTNNGKVKDSSILYTVIDANKKKYGANQVMFALTRYIKNNDSTGFTRGNIPNRNLRLELEYNLSPNDVLKIVEDKIGSFSSIEEGCEKFINSIYADDISLEKETKIKKENLFFDSLKEVYNRYGYEVLIETIKKSFIDKKDIIIKIIEISYPQMSKLEINDSINNGNYIYLIGNLVKGYEDIQDKPKEKQISYFDSLVKIYNEFGTTVLLMQVTKDLKNNEKREEIKNIIKKIKPDLLEDRIEFIINTGFGQEMIINEIIKSTEKNKKYKSEI